MRRMRTLPLLLGALLGCDSPGRAGDPELLFRTISQDEINRDAYGAGLLFAIGRHGFDRSWTCAEGGGLGSGGSCHYDRMHGPESQSCAECHDTPLHDGGGALAANVFRLFDPNSQQFVERNPPHLFGAGYVEALAEEMSSELQAQRAQALAQAAQAGTAVTVALFAKGLDFGMLRAQPDGTAAYLGSAVQEDLIVRPFFAKGMEVSIRSQNVGALIAHLGIQPTELIGAGVDQDGDGVRNEISAGQVSAMVAYQALLALPSFVAVSGAVEDGAQVFHAVGCAGCHTPILRLEDPRLFLSDPAQPQTGLWLDLPRDGEPPRGLRLGESGPVLVPLFSDLRRHDVGPLLADYRDTPLLPSPLSPVPPVGSAELQALPRIPAATFLTTRLWGVGSTAPYLHHGRATDLDQAVRAHGGEATFVRQAYEQLDDTARGSLLDFLRSLVLTRDPGLAAMPPSSGAGY